MNAPREDISPLPAPGRAGPALRRGGFEPLTLAMLLSMLAAAALFTLWPELDLKTSAFFYRPESHDFVGKDNALAMAAYRFIPSLSKFLIASVALALVTSFILRHPRARAWRIRLGFLAAVLALGPGLIVDIVLKDGVGRARPVRIVEFGGNVRFTPAFVLSDQCARNCSFVSGHASAGFFFASFGFLGGAAARRRWTMIGFALGGLAGLGRISEGGHFLSDVVFAFYFVWFSAWLVWLLFRRLGWLPDRGSP